MLKFDLVKNTSNSVFKGKNDNNSTRKLLVTIENYDNTVTKTLRCTNGTVIKSQFNSKYLHTHNPKDRYPVNITLENYCGKIQKWHTSPERYSIVISVNGRAFLKDIFKNDMVVYKVNDVNVFDRVVSAKSELASKVDAKFRELYRYVVAGHPKLFI